jgi:hypothetical protein
MTTMKQQVKNIKIHDLVLWTENPRDPIDKDATDQKIIDRALLHTSSKWNLSKLAKDMGDYYDLSELPTVVFHGEKPIVYDGNRRIILGKIKHKLVNVPDNFSKIRIPDFPLEIPCNVCIEEIALKNVLRKHGDSGSWDPLERDIFLHKFMGESKSAFLVLEENTGVISENPCLNQGFVKNEILNNENLKALGFSIQGESLNSIHSDEESRQILSDISRKITEKEITTRKRRGQVIEVLEPSTQELIDQNKGGTPRPITWNHGNSRSKPEINDEKSRNNEHKPEDLDNKTSQTKNLDNKTSRRQSRRTIQKEAELFGGKLYLHTGKASDLYRDVVDLYAFYIDRKDRLSSTFPGLIRMSLRLLCETAATEKKYSSFDNYLKNNYAEAKRSLDQDAKTTLSNQSVDENKIVQLLHTGAHNYKSSNNIHQTIALSIIIGAILTITHRKESVG